MTQNRRQFLQQVTASGAGLIFAPSILSAMKMHASGMANGKPFIGGIVPIAAIEDSCTLAFASDSIPYALRNDLVSDIHLRVSGNRGRLANMIPTGDQSFINLLDHLKDNQDDEKYHSKVALAFGYAAVNGFYEIWKPVYSAYSSPEERLEAMIYQDMALLRELSKRKNPDAKISVDEFYEILNVMLPRALTRIHTLKPDMDDGKGWVTRMTQWRIQSLDLFRKYAEAYVIPESGKLTKYVNNMSFYGSDDLVEMLFKLKNGISISSKEADSFMHNGKTSGLYSKALVRGYQNINITADYLVGKTSANELSKVMALA